MKNSVLCEICVESLDGAIVAQEAGAHRIELCGSLTEGGITPSAALIRLAKKCITLPTHVIIRPRGGDFCYSPAEFDTIKNDIAFALDQNVEGIVIGLLNPNGTVDVDRTAALIQTAHPMSVTFHRAFDMTRDPTETLETLISLGIDRILTSGCAPSVDRGIETITQLVEQANNRITIMPGGGIHEKNAASLIRETGVREIHFSARSNVDSPMTFRNSELTLNDTKQSSDYIRKTTDANRIRAIIHAISKE